MQNSFDRAVPHKDMVCCHWFVWTPVVIGAFIALGLGFLLDLLVKGVGLSLYTNDVEGAITLAIGGFIGIALGGFITMFFSGFMSGYFAGPMGKKGQRNLGCIYGLVAWCLSLILVGLFASNLANYNANKYDSRVSMSANEMATTTQHVTNRMHPATDASDTQAEKNVRATGIVSLAMFFIFLIGALGAIFGGHCGVNHWNKWDRDEVTR